MYKESSKASHGGKKNPPLSIIQTRYERVEQKRDCSKLFCSKKFFDECFRRDCVDRRESKQGLSAYESMEKRGQCLILQLYGAVVLNFASFAIH